METNETLTRKKRYIAPEIDELLLDSEGLMDGVVISAGGSDVPVTPGWGNDAKQSNGLINYMNFDEQFAAYEESASNVFDYY